MLALFLKSAVVVLKALPIPFLGASRSFLPVFDASRSDPRLPPLAGTCALLVRADCPRRGWFTCHGTPPHLLFRAMGNHPASVWSADGSPSLTHDWPSLPPFPRSLSRCYPLLHRSSVLWLWCADETSSAQGTICVPSLHLLIRRREEARKGRWAGGDQVHPPALSAFRTSSCLCRRNRTWTVTLLAVHAASGHEA